jgi:hypothetical protein
MDFWEKAYSAPLLPLPDDLYPDTQTHRSMGRRFTNVLFVRDRPLGEQR